MARCGCSGSCSCIIKGSGGIAVRGSGTLSSPYDISGGFSLGVEDTPSVNLTLTGNGDLNNPYGLKADAKLNLDDLSNVNTSGGQAGYVLAQQPNGSYTLVPPATTAPGVINTDDSIDGDGSSGDPLGVNLGFNSGLEISGSGLRLAASGSWQNYDAKLVSDTEGVVPLPEPSYIQGRYKRDGNIVHLAIVLRITNTFVPIGGNYGITLPVPAHIEGNIRQLFPIKANFEDDGGNTARGERLGIANIEPAGGPGFIYRMFIDRGGYSTAIGHNYPTYNRGAVHVTMSGSYEASV